MARGYKRKVYKCDKVTMKILDRYDSIKDAAKAEGTSYSVMNFALCSRSVGRKPYVLRYADDYDPFESFEGKRGRPVLMLDVVDGKVYTFNTLKDAADALLLDLSYVCKCMKEKTYALGCYKLEYAR